jgi:hypothetical protein
MARGFEGFALKHGNGRGFLSIRAGNVEMAEGFLISDRGFRIGDRFGW